MIETQHSWTMWLRWERATAGARIGTIERLPRVVGAIFVARAAALRAEAECQRRRAG